MYRATVSAFLNHKGGVGKTTSVANVGAGLTILGNKVLLIDLDPQGHLTRFLGIEPGELGRTLYDVLRGDVPARDAVITRPLHARLHMDGRETQMSLSLIPASIDLADADAALAGAGDRDTRLRRVLAGIADDYDHILLDCPPSLGLVTSNALAAAQIAFIPIQTEYLALESLHNLLSRIESISHRVNPGLEIGGLIATRFDGRKVLSRDVVLSLRERFGAMLLDTIVRDNIALAESPGAGKDIFSYRPRSFGAEDYMNLSVEIMDRIASLGDNATPDLEAFESQAGGSF